MPNAGRHVRRSAAESVRPTKPNRPSAEVAPEGSGQRNRSSRPRWGMRPCRNGPALRDRLAIGAALSAGASRCRKSTGMPVSPWVMTTRTGAPSTIHPRPAENRSSVSLRRARNRSDPLAAEQIHGRIRRKSPQDRRPGPASLHSVANDTSRKSRLGRHANRSPREWKRCASRSGMDPGRSRTRPHAETSLRQVGHRRHHRIWNTPSISTATPRGSEATPTAERACRPASPRTSTRKSEAPLITLG